MKRLLLITILISLCYSQRDLGSYSVVEETFIWKKPEASSKKLSKVDNNSFILLSDTLVNGMVFANYKGIKGWLPVKTIMKGSMLEDFMRTQRLKSFKRDIYDDLKLEIEPTPPPPVIKKKEAPKPVKKLKTNNAKKTSNKADKPAQKKTVKKQSQSEDILDDPRALFLIISLLSIISIFLLVKYLKIRYKYSDIIDIDSEVEISERKNKKLRKNYKSNKKIYKSLIEEVNRLKDDLVMMDNGIYEPIFDFDTSEKHKNNVKLIRAEQKTLIRNKRAVLAHTEWTVEGSKAKGRTMTNRAIRMTLRAYNGECDAAIAKVKWNNVRPCLNRIEKSSEMLDKLNASNNMTISREYKRLKRRELRAVHEYAEKKQLEKEERRERLKNEREEKRVQQEAIKAQKEAEKEKKLAEEALLAAKKELGMADGAELEKKNEQIRLLEEQLKEAIEKGERAKSRAQFTKQGHVYVISNLGSFGEGVYKIGLTRRLEPLDRVRELGDASVPFLFDLHAMIFSEDAPSLEKQLHSIFDEKRLNLVNRRKEFFKVSLEEIEDEVAKIEPTAEFIKTAESREFRETQSLLRSKMEEVEQVDFVEDKFPDEI